MNVQLTLTPNILSGPAARIAAIAAFGIEPAMIDGLIRYNQSLEVECRADQFAYFIVDRNDRSGTNLIKELSPKLKPTETPARRSIRRPPSFVDVTKN